jgi:hypothetical protein
MRRRSLLSGSSTAALALPARGQAHGWDDPRERDELRSRLAAFADQYHLPALA